MSKKLTPQEEEPKPKSKLKKMLKDKSSLQQAIILQEIIKFRLDDY